MTILIGCLTAAAMVLVMGVGALLVAAWATRQRPATVFGEARAIPFVIWWVAARRKDVLAYQAVGVYSPERMVSLDKRGWTPALVVRFNESKIGWLPDALDAEVFTAFEPHLLALSEALVRPSVEDMTNWHLAVGGTAPLAIRAGLSLAEATRMDLDGTLDPDTLTAMSALRT